MKCKITFLGKKAECLDIATKTTMEERIARCNELIKFISERDRKFFDNDGIRAKFIKEKDSTRLAFLDEYFEHYWAPHLQTWKKKRFNGGGTLKELVHDMAVYIKTGTPFFFWRARISNWGYSKESAEAIKQKGIELGVWTAHERWMIWTHSFITEEQIAATIDHYQADRARTIVVQTGLGSPEPLWLGEFNFNYCSPQKPAPPCNQ